MKNGETVFKCYELLNDDKDDPEEVGAYSADHAAEKYAEIFYNNGGFEADMHKHPTDIMVIHPDGREELFAVTMEYNPVFTAYEKEPKP